MSGKKSKIFVLAGMIAPLVVPGALNIWLNGTQAKAASGGEYDDYTASDFFAAYRADRTATRNQSIMYLDEIIESGVESDEAVEKAKLEKAELAAAMDLELRLETLIKAVGFEDAIVTTTGEKINVILRSGELENEQVAKVLNVIKDETGKRATAVRIIPVE